MRAVTVPVPPLFLFSNFVTKNIRFFLIIMVCEGEMASYCFTKHGKSGFTSVLVGFFSHYTLGNSESSPADRADFSTAWPVIPEELLRNELELFQQSS